MIHISKPLDKKLIDYITTINNHSLYGLVFNTLAITIILMFTIMLVIFNICHFIYKLIVRLIKYIIYVMQDSTEQYR